MRAAGLAGGGRGESARAHRVGSAEVQHPLHHVGHHVGHARIENVFSRGIEIFDHIALGVAQRGDHDGLHARAIVGKHGVCRGHVERRRIVRAQRHGRRGHHALDARRLGQIGHFVVAHLLRQLYRGIVQ